MKTFTFTVTAEFEIHGTVKAEDEAGAEAKLQDMELAVFERHHRRVVLSGGRMGTINYPPTVGVHMEGSHSFKVGEIQDPHVTDLSVEEGG